MTQSVAPIGALEDERTEFKGAEALRRLEPISRSVVAMLNARGGDIWIGVKEENERGAGIEPIADVEREKRRVEDHLMSAIEPSPRHDEFHVEPFALGAGANILVVKVEPGTRRPYAQLKGGARHYLVRVGARSRPMTRDEIAEAFSESRGSVDKPRARSETAWKKEAQSALANGRKELWVRIAFEPALKLPDDRPTVEALDGWLRDPSKTANRVMGWTFASDYGESFQPLPRDDDHPGGFRAGGDKGWTWLEVRLDGEIIFRVPRAKLELPEGELYPYALVEYPTSVVRLAAELHRAYRGKSGARVLLDIGLIGLQGLRIRPGVPGSPAYLFEAEEITSDVVRAEPHEGSAAALVEAPDAFAWSALTALYFQLGFFEDRMPVALYDVQHRKLRFPK